MNHILNNNNGGQNKKSIDNLLKYLDLNSSVGVPNSAETAAATAGGEKVASMPVLDINRVTELPATVADKRQNKNDFYRFLLMQNTNQHQAEETNLTTIGQRANNDILIPRSILKKCERTFKPRDHHLSEDED